MIKGMWALKLRSNKLFQLLTGMPANTG